MVLVLVTDSGSVQHAEQLHSLRIWQYSSVIRLSDSLQSLLATEAVRIWIHCDPLRKILAHLEISKQLDKCWHMDQIQDDLQLLCTGPVFKSFIRQTFRRPPSTLRIVHLRGLLQSPHQINEGTGALEAACL